MTNLEMETKSSQDERGAAAGVERRTSPRYPIPKGLPLEVRVLPSTDVVNGWLHDVSRDGVGLVTQVYIAPGESITFPIGSNWIVAEVQHCRAGANGYVLGAMISETVREEQSQPAETHVNRPAA
jgi:hypothetical protein